MEPEWKKYLRENHPNAYEDMVADCVWEAKWRDEKIDELKEENKELKLKLSLVTNCPFITGKS